MKLICTKHRFDARVVCPLILLALGACGGGSQGGDATRVASDVPVQAAALSILTQPSAATATAGSAASFSVTASSSDPITYQWLKNGSPIVGATAAAYTVTAPTIADSGAVFSVMVTSGGTSLTSASAALTVSAAAVALGNMDTACLQPAEIPLGSTLTVRSKSSLKTVEDDFSYRSLRPTLFNGVETTALEATTATVGSPTSTVTTDYFIRDSATGSVTHYGEVDVQTTGTATSKLTFTYQPPAIVPALVLNQPVPFSLNATLVIERTSGGIAQPTLTQQSGGSGQITLLGIESVTVPAGTYQACKIRTDAGPNLSTTSWLLVDYGVAVKSITTTGATVDTSVANSVALNGQPLR